MTHLFRGDLAQAERFVSEALGSFRSSGNQRGAAWALQNLAWISFSHGNIAARREPARGVGRPLRRARRLGRAQLGLRTARVRPLQPGPARGGRRDRRAHRDRGPRDRQPLGGRHDERAARERRALERAHTRVRRAGQRGDRAVPGDRRPLGRGDGDRVGRPRPRRARPRRARTRRRSRATTRSRARCPTRACTTFPALVEASVQLQRGNAPRRDAALSRRSTRRDENELGAADTARRDRARAPAARRRRRRDRGARGSVRGRDRRRSRASRSAAGSRSPTPPRTAATTPAACSRR